MTTDLTHTISIASAARHAAIHPNAVRDWLRRGLVEGVRTPLGTVVVANSLEAYLQRRKHRGLCAAIAR
jgi:hypothetical protein